MKIKELGLYHHRLAWAVLVLCITWNTRAQNADIPFLKKQGQVTQLIAEGKPFLMLAGELGNSSASSPQYMRPFWPGLKKMHLNTALVPVYWELIEPAEGKFDFAFVDSSILSARKYGMKIVFLWFGTWKNSMSCYAPLWVKTDDQRFPRARKQDGTAVEIMTPFSEVNCNADSRAFVEFMKHIRQFDAKERTVIMIQVENEIGMVPEARDYCALANKAFTQPVPEELMVYLAKNKTSLAPELLGIWKSQGMKAKGTWEEVFGKGLQTDEIFMAWYFATYTGNVASAGKSEYPLPMYVNAALIREGAKPGQYPSAGPLPHLIDIWRAAAPSIDFLSPDIYFRSFAEWTGKYDQPGNPLFIPEVGNNQKMVQAFYAFARHNAMGYSPFSIESLTDVKNNSVEAAYGLLEQISPLILEHQGKGTMAGFLLDSTNQKEQLKLGDYIFNIRHEYSWPFATRTEAEPPRVGGLIIMLGPDEFLIAGSGVVVTFESAIKDGTIAGIGSLEEVNYVSGKWITGRRMNGDQSHQGRHMYLPGDQYSMQKVRLYSFK